MSRYRSNKMRTRAERSCVQQWIRNSLLFLGQTDTEYRTEFSFWALLNSPLIVDTVRLLNWICLHYFVLFGLFDTLTDRMWENWHPSWKKYCSIQKWLQSIKILLCNKVIVFRIEDVNRHILQHVKCGQNHSPLATNSLSFSTTQLIPNHMTSLSNFPTWVRASLQITEKNSLSHWSQCSGWQGGTKALVRDLWKHQNVGVFQDVYTARQVPPHGVTFVTLTQQ